MRWEWIYTLKRRWTLVVVVLGHLVTVEDCTRWLEARTTSLERMSVESSLGLAYTGCNLSVLALDGR